MSARLILCADDFGFSPGVSGGILELVAAGRLSATGCMTLSPFWPAGAVALRPWAGRIDVGVHLTLTVLEPLGPMPVLAPGGRFPALGRLTAQALAGRLPVGEIEAEIGRQIDRFQEWFGAPPDFLDGHQHIHVLPGIREAVLAAARRLPGCAVRDCREPLNAILKRGVAPAKAAVVSALGAGLHRRLVAEGWTTNGGFRGVYGLEGGADRFARHLERFLEPPGPDPKRPPLVMVHPGFPDEALRRVDPVIDQRLAEFEVLAGDRLPDLLGRRGLELCRFGGRDGAAAK